MSEEAFQKAVRDMLIDELPPELRNGIRSYVHHESEIQHEMDEKFHRDKIYKELEMTKQALSDTINKATAQIEALNKEIASLKADARKDKFWKISGWVIGIMGLIIGLIALIFTIIPYIQAHHAAIMSIIS